jgi:hypothetical protein
MVAAVVAVVGGAIGAPGCEVVVVVEGSEVVVGGGAVSDSGVRVVVSTVAAAVTWTLEDVLPRVNARETAPMNPTVPAAHGRRVAVLFAAVAGPSGLIDRPGSSSGRGTRLWSIPTFCPGVAEM